MATIKQGPAPEDHYTLIPNSLSRSPDLTSRAKVVYIYLKSHRDGWNITTERVAEALGMSKETVVKAIQDLVDAGYVRREKIRGDGGTYSGWEYEVLSWPTTTVGKTDHGKSPWSENPDVGESGPHKKTNSFKKTNGEEDQPPVVPQRGTAPGAGVARIEDHPGTGYPPAFEAWWADYPKKTGKKDAHRKWKAAKKNIGADELHRRLLGHLPALLAKDPQYVPNPSTWLNQGRYDDPVEDTTPPPTQQDQRRQRLLEAGQRVLARQEPQHDYRELG